MTMKQNFPHVIIEEKDIPGASHHSKTFPATPALPWKDGWQLEGWLQLGRKLIWSKDKVFFPGSGKQGVVVDSLYLGLTSHYGVWGGIRIFSSVIFS